MTPAAAVRQNATTLAECVLQLPMRRTSSRRTTASAEQTGFVPDPKAPAPEGRVPRKEEQTRTGRPPRRARPARSRRPAHAPGRFPAPAAPVGSTADDPKRLHPLRSFHTDEAEASRNHRLRGPDETQETECLGLALEDTVLVVEAMEVVGDADRVVRDRLRAALASASATTSGNSGSRLTARAPRARARRISRCRASPRRRSAGSRRSARARTGRSRRGSSGSSRRRGRRRCRSSGRARG